MLERFEDETLPVTLRSDPIPGSQHFRLRVYLAPLTVLAVALPLTLYAIICSRQWFAAPFPGMLLMPNAVVTTVSTFDWPPQRTRLFHARIVSVDGVAVRSSSEVYAAVAGKPAGTPFTYAAEKADQRFEIAFASRQFTLWDYLQTYGLILFVGSTYLILGVIVGFLQPRSVQARVFMGQALVAGIYPITGVFLHLPDFPLLGQLNLVFESFFGATWLHLGLHFPMARRFSGATRLLPMIPYALGGAFALLVLNGVGQRPPQLQALHALYAFNGGCIALFLLAVAYGYWENRAPVARQRIKAFLPGLFAASLLPLFAFLNNAFGGGDFPVQFGLLLIPLLQGSLAYAIARHDLFDIDRVVRQTFIYQLLSLIVVGTYALSLSIAGRVLPASSGVNQASISTVFLIFLAFALEPLRRGVQTLVDRAFYRVRLDYTKTIGELSAVMATLLDLHELADQVTRVPAQAMQLASTHLAVKERDKWVLWSRLSTAVLQAKRDAPAAAALADVAARSPREFAASTLARRAYDPGEAAAVHDILEHTAAAVVLPLVSRGELVGLLLLGAKRSGQAFGADDIALLRTLANQTAIAVQNACSYAAVQELAQSLDAKVQEQTAELRRAYDDLKAAEAHLVQSEKMASLGQLVAGIAHELNNPASFVHGGLANLTDYLDRLMQVLQAYETMPAADPAQRQELARVRHQMRVDVVLRETPALLRACNEGTARIARIVNDLRLFARSDRGERTPADVAETIESSLRLLSHRTSALHVTLVRDYQRVPRLPLNVNQIGQVWMNLLVNALDAVEERPHPRIEISVHDAPTKKVGDQPGVEVNIRDNGVGIATADQAKIFEPFFTTKEVGRGTGLGLSIAYGIVKNHRGTIHVESDGTNGTTMTVRLPVDER